jgi:hypothetical protein
MGEDFAAASALAQPFIVSFVVLHFRAPPSASQWASVDPIMRLLPPGPTLWLVPSFGIALAIAWLVIAWPPWRVFGGALLWGLAGAGLVGGAAALWLRMRGAHLPPGVRLEESVRQGLCLGTGAGYLEEMLVRVGVLPLIFLHMADRPKWFAALIASLVSGLAFAALHEPGTTDWSSLLFVARFAVPGFAMSLLALLTRPSFVVVAHCAAHVIIPIFFV